MSSGPPMRRFLGVLAALLLLSCRTLPPAAQTLAHRQTGLPASTASQAATAQISFDPFSASIALIAAIATIIGTAQNWPKPTPGGESIEYIFYGSSSDHQVQCPLLIQTTHQNNQPSQQLISDKPVNNKCTLSDNAHLKAGTVYSDWADHQPARIKKLKITATGPQLASFSRIVLRLGGHLQQTGLGDRAMIMLDAGLVDYCYKRGFWKFGGNPMPAWSTHFIEDEGGWFMQMGTSNQWGEFEFFSIEEMVQDLDGLGREMTRWQNPDRFRAEEAVAALDRLCHHFQPTRWNEGNTCSACCSFTRNRTMRAPSSLPRIGAPSTPECNGPIVPEEKWQSDW